MPCTSLLVGFHACSFSIGEHDSKRFPGVREVIFLVDPKSGPRGWEDAGAAAYAAMTVDQWKRNKSTDPISIQIDPQVSEAYLWRRVHTD